MKPRHALLFCLFSLLGFACAVPAPRPPAAQLEDLWRTHAAELAPLTHWELRGRLAVRTDDRGGQASLTWLRDAARHSIRLNGPLGRGVLRVTQDEHGARLTDSEQRVLEARDAQQLIYLYTGWQLPIASLEWWVRGLPVPGVEAGRELDGDGRLDVLRQQGWEVRYQEYAQVEGRSLPTRLELTRPASGSEPSMQARLVIDQWVQVK